MDTESAIHSLQAIPYSAACLDKHSSRRYTPNIYEHIGLPYTMVLETLVQHI